MQLVKHIFAAALCLAAADPGCCAERVAPKPECALFSKKVDGRRHARVRDGRTSRKEIGAR